jgi:SAM-dependent methyltransferase
MGLLSYKVKYDIDDPERTIEHGEIIKSKLFLRKMYEYWYAEFKNSWPDIENKKVLEIGSGGGFLKDVIPSIITSDIMPLKIVDKVFSAEDMPFADKELNGICMLNVFHHIPTPENFLSEAQRVLKQGGKIILIEPANSLWGRFIYRNFHHEPFEPKGGWTIESTGPLSGANGALPWIIFERDREKFLEKFPNLKIESIKYHTPFRYLLSGGVSRKSLLPVWLFNTATIFEKLLSPFSKQLGMFVTIEITKK